MKIKPVFRYFLALLLVLFSLSMQMATAYAQDIYVNAGNVNINSTEIDKKGDIVVPLGQYLYVGSPSIVIPDDKGYANAGASAIATGACTYISGNCAIALAHTYYATVGIRHNGQDYTTTGQYGIINVKTGDLVIISVVTDPAGNKYTGNMNVSNKFMGTVFGCTNSDCSGTGKETISNIYFSANITITQSTCSIATAHDMAFVWLSLSPSQIANGSAETQTAPITMSCTGNAVPVAVTVSSNTGSYDAANGLIKTDKANLGLKLTWAGSGRPVALDSAFEFPSTGEPTEDFSVNAQPVALGGGAINAGDFSATVTVSFDYH